MADQNPWTRLRENASKIAQWDLESLIHPKNGGPFNFVGHKDLFQNIQNLYREVSSANLDFMPPNIAEGFANKAESVVRALSRVQDFNIKSGGDLNQTAAQIIQDVAGTWRESFDYGALPIAYALTISGAISGHINKMTIAMEGWDKAFKDVVNGFTDRSNELEKQVEGRVSDLEKTIKAAREAAKLEGVAQQATAFDEQAKSDRNAARLWLVASIASVIVGLILVWGMFLGNWVKVAGTDPASDPKVITPGFVQQTVARILIMTLVYAAVVWCARNYFASRHNYTVNRHRRNAMQTFRAFVEGSQDKATQDFILRQAAQCAFSPQQTGYLKDESLPTPGPAADIINIAKPDLK